MKLEEFVFDGYNVAVRIYASGFVRIQLERADRWIECRRNEGALRLSDVPTSDERKIFHRILHILKEEF